MTQRRKKDVGGVSAVKTATTAVIMNPQAVQRTAEFVGGFFSPGPPSSPSPMDNYGSLAGRAYDYITSTISQTSSSSSSVGGKRN